MGQSKSSWLIWTAWAPLEREAIRCTAPASPGLYRIRRAGEATERLVYIGQTGRTLRERLRSLATGVNADECPFNDPHTAAPHLWLLRQLQKVRFEWSCAAVTADPHTLRGIEDMLLWRHRVETGLSTEANYGRFYKGFSRPTNGWRVSGGLTPSRSPGRRARPLAEGKPGVDFDLSHPVLQGQDGPLQADWWTRVPLQSARALPAGPAVYCIQAPHAEEALYIGETSRLAARAAAHAGRPWPVPAPIIAYLPQPVRTPKHVLREAESDLLGWHFWCFGKPPSAQYGAPVAGAEAPQP